MTEILCIVNIIISIFLIYLSFKSLYGQLVIFPITTAIFTYTGLPVSEQVLLNLTPNKGRLLLTHARDLIVINWSFALIFLTIALFIANSFKPHSLQKPQTNPLSSLVLIAIGILLLFYSTNFNPFILNDYRASTVLSTSSVLIPLSKYCISVGICLYCFSVVSKFNSLLHPTVITTLLISCCLILLFTFFTMDKQPLLPLIAMIIFLFGRTIAQRGFIFTVLTMATAILCMQLFMIYFAYNRAGLTLPEMNSRFYERGASDLSVTSADAGGPYLSLSHAFNVGLPDHLYLTFFETVQSVLPKFITGPFRPETISQRYAKTYIHRFDLGMGLGFHPMAEFHFYFGDYLAWLFVPLLLLLASFSYVLVRFSILPPLFQIPFLLITFSALLISNRSPVEGVYKDVFANSVFCLSIFAIATIVSQTILLIYPKK